jgi:hypothetical protein
MPTELFNDNYDRNMTVYTLQDLADELDCTLKTAKNFNADPDIDIPFLTNPRNTVQVIPESAAKEMARVYKKHGVKGLRKGYHIPRYELNRVEA